MMKFEEILFKFMVVCGITLAIVIGGFRLFSDYRLKAEFGEKGYLERKAPSYITLTFVDENENTIYHEEFNDMNEPMKIAGFGNIYPTEKGIENLESIHFDFILDNISKINSGAFTEEYEELLPLGLHTVHRIINANKDKIDTGKGFQFVEGIDSISSIKDMSKYLDLSKYKVVSDTISSLTNIEDRSINYEFLKEQEVSNKDSYNFEEEYSKLTNIRDVVVQFDLKPEFKFDGNFEYKSAVHVTDGTRIISEKESVKIQGNVFTQSSGMNGWNSVSIQSYSNINAQTEISLTNEKPFIAWDTYDTNGEPKGEVVVEATYNEVETLNPGDIVMTKQKVYVDTNGRNYVPSWFKQ